MRATRAPKLTPEQLARHLRAISPPKDPNAQAKRLAGTAVMGLVAYFLFFRK